MSNESKLWKSKKGKLVRQLYEECDKCGRPCQVAGRGICTRCIQQETERKEAGMYCNTLQQAATYCNELEHTATLGHLWSVHPTQKQAQVSRRCASFVCHLLLCHTSSVFTSRVIWSMSRVNCFYVTCHAFLCDTSYVSTTHHAFTRPCLPHRDVTYCDLTCWDVARLFSAMCCGVLQCVAVCFSVLQCVAVYHSELQCVEKRQDSWVTCLAHMSH